MVPFSSMFILSPTNPYVADLNMYSFKINLIVNIRVRKLIHTVVSSSYFEMVVTVVICMSSIALAAEDPVEEGSLRNRILGQFDVAFTCVFTVEMILKVSRQVYLHEK